MDNGVALEGSEAIIEETTVRATAPDMGFTRDEGYYFKDKPGIVITHDTKNWWAQAEGLNTLLLMSDHFPNDEHQYYQKFLKLWQYCDKNLIDHQYGDWFEGGIDKQPEKKTALKGHIWKATYHQYRSLINCIKRLNGEEIHP